MKSNLKFIHLYTNFKLNGFRFTKTELGYSKNKIKKIPKPLIQRLSFNK